MNRPPTVRRPLPVHFRGHRGLALLLALLLAAPALPAPARAQDGGGSGREEGRKGGAGKAKGGEGAKEEEPKRKSGEERLLEVLGGAWKARDAKALADRFPGGRKVSLHLPGVEAGEYRAEQAKSLLEDYFKGRTFAKVVLRSVRERTGTFEVEYRRSSDRRTVEAEVLLVLGTEERKRVLVSARESP